MPAPDPVVIDRHGRVIASSPADVVPLAVLAETPDATGVLLAPADTLEALLPHLAHLTRIEVDFPKFRDGRGFTQARALREHHGYTGDIRAVGHVLPDQFQSLLRCGVSTVQLAQGQDPNVWAAVLALRGGLDALPATERPVPLLRRLVAAFDA